MTKPLNKYLNFSSKARNSVLSTVKLIDEKKYRDAEKEFAFTAIDILKELRNGELTPSDTDEVFTLLDVYISDNLVQRSSFNKVLFELLMEGMHLHHYGDNTNWGPDLDEMINFAKELLQ